MQATLSHPIAVLWAAGGPAIGAYRAHTRVSVEIGWELRTSTGAVGSYKKLPIRWFQRADGSEVLTEIPNVKIVKIERSIEVDAATSTVTLLNTTMATALDPLEIGQPGYLTPQRGSNATATTRWGHVPTAWANVLVPNALIRIHQGYGGHEKTLAQAITDGNLIQTFTGLIDEVHIGALPGTIDLKIRDMMKLAIDQPIFPPLVPETDTDGQQVYPLEYCSTFPVTGSQNVYIAYGDFVQAGRHIVGMAYVDGSSPSAGRGYWLGGDDGGVFTYGYQPFYGSASGSPLNSPIVGIARTATGRGYWLVAADGGVFSYGDADFYGSLPDSAIVPNQPVCGIERSPGGLGYYLVAGDGGVWAYGDAVYSGNGVGTISGTCVGMAVRPGGGYWLLTNTGAVYSFGAASYHGGDSGATDWTAIESTPSGAGYYTVRGIGAVYTHGDASYQGGHEGSALNDPIVDIVVHPGNTGYWLAAGDGGVFTYGTGLNFYGALPGPWTNQTAGPGNIADYVDVIKELALWAGWWLNGASPNPSVYGNIESTSASPPECLPSDLFDKRAVIDVWTKIKEIVSFDLRVDETGALIFATPNIWQPGNYYPDGTHTTDIPVLDEGTQLTDYTVGFTDRPLRSEIIISSVLPSLGVDGTVTTRYLPQGRAGLKGIVKPFMWVNQMFVDAPLQLLMAQLIDLRLWFQNRLGSVSMLANPLLQLGDQIRIFERQSDEVYVHSIRTIDSTHDLESGEYTMALTTNWLGEDSSNWAMTWPTTYVPSVTNPVGITDSRSVVYTHGRTPTDAEGITDSRSVVTTSARTQTDPEGIVDSRTVVTTSARTQTDPEGITDAVSPVATYARPTVDPEGITDAVAPALTINLSITDSVGVLDTQTPLLAVSVPVTDGVGMTDSIVTAGSALFSFTGSEQTFTVPPGVTALAIDCQAAQGNEGVSTWGKGARTQATLAVTAGEVLRLNVGGQPAGATGGFGGGGNGGTGGSQNGRAGGGASDVRQGGTTLGDRVVVAGGGGGANAADGSSGGGTTGQDGGSVGSPGGGLGLGGTPSAGGAGGAAGLFTAGSAGSLGSGGAGAAGTLGGVGGDGGGGGYYGGGGGGDGWDDPDNGFSGGTGGGGSSYAGTGTSAVTHTRGYRAGHGQIMVTW